MPVKCVSKYLPKLGDGLPDGLGDGLGVALKPTKVPERTVVPPFLITIESPVTIFGMN